MPESLGQARWMSVNNVMTKDVLCIPGEEDVKDAWMILMEAEVSGAPVVDAAGALVGVLSTTDIFRAIMERVLRARTLRESTSQDEDPMAAEREAQREFSLAVRAVTDSKVLSILPKDQKVISLSPEDSLERALHLIAEHGVNRLPVVKDNHVVGIITRQDIIWQIAGRPPPSHQS